MYVDYMMNNRSVVDLSRSYRYIKKLEEFIINENFFDYNENLNILNEVDTTSKRFWFDEYILERNYRNLKEIAKLDIWDKDFLDAYNLKDPRKWYFKILHSYLHSTQKYKSNIVIRAIDKVLKKLV